MRSTWLAGVFLLGVGCGGDDGVRHLADAPPGDQGSNGDGAIDAPIDGSGGAFTLKDTCSTPAAIADYTGDVYASRPVIVAAPGAPIVAVWNMLTLSTQTSSCEGMLYSSGGWGNPHTIAPSCEGTEAWHVAAGGTGAIATWSAHNSGVSRRTYLQGTTWTELGTPTDDVFPYSRVVAAGSGGHIVEAIHTTGGIAVNLIAPNGAAFTPLAVNPVTGGIGRIAAVVGADGTGWALWIESATNTVVGRPFSATAWSGAAVPLATGGSLADELTAARLPDGGVYAAWVRTDVSGLHGATLSSGGTWSAIDDLDTGGTLTPRVLVASDGELTAVWATNDGSGNFTLTSRRRAAGSATFAAEVTVAAPPTTTFDAQLDAAGHLTVARLAANRIEHFRLAKGETAWRAVVRVDTAGSTNASGPVSLAIEPASGDLLVAWIVGNDLMFSRCQ